MVATLLQEQDDEWQVADAWQWGAADIARHPEERLTPDKPQPSDFWLSDSEAGILRRVISRSAASGAAEGRDYVNACDPHLQPNRREFG